MLYFQRKSTYVIVHRPLSTVTYFKAIVFFYFNIPKRTNRLFIRRTAKRYVPSFIKICDISGYDSGFDKYFSLLGCYNMSAG
jgi:hypothetical protein